MNIFHSRGRSVRASRFAFFIAATWTVLAATSTLAQELPATGKENLSELAPVQHDKTLLAPVRDPQEVLLEKEYSLQSALLQKQLAEVRAKLQKAEAEGSEEAKALAREARRLAEQEKELSTQYEVYLKRLAPKVEQLQPDDVRSSHIHSLEEERKRISIALEVAQLELEGAKAQEANARQAAEETKKRLEMQMQKLAQRERQFAEAMAAQQRNRELPPIENGAVQVFSLRHVPAADAVKTIESLFGTQPVRLAVDERTNSLIVFGKQEALPAVEELLLRLDKSEDESSKSKEPSREQGEKEASRSLLLRVFWLADGLSEDEGRDPRYVLPQSVLEAVNQLGVINPRLVTQTVTSLAVQGDEKVAFSTSIPAALDKLYPQLKSEGHMKLLPGKRANVDMAIRVEGPIQCDLSGSLVAPLGHYMVLGTASSLVPERRSAGNAEKKDARADEARKAEAERKMLEIAGGRAGGYGGAGRPGGGYGEGGYGGGLGGYGGYSMEGGYGGGGYGMGGRGAMPAGGMAGHATNFDTSRFAFVVQVIESESYSGEAVNSDAKVHDHYRRPNGKPRE